MEAEESAPHRSAGNMGSSGNWRWHTAAVQEIGKQWQWRWHTVVVQENMGDHAARHDRSAGNIWQNEEKRPQEEHHWD